MQAPKQDYTQSLTKIDPDEQVLAIIKRHPFGIIKLYISVFVGLAAAGGLISFLLPEFFSQQESPGAYALLATVSLVVFSFMLIIVGIATVIYNKNTLVVTDKTITQTLQTSLFSKKTSQLAVTSIEDVTANTNGFFPTVLRYGKLLIETAGEQENFYFDYCPQAEHYAKLVLETRQEFMGSRELQLRDAGRAHAVVEDQSSQTLK